MNHLERALDHQNQWWKYLIITGTAFLAANVIGSIPLLIVLFLNGAFEDPETLSETDNIMDLSAFGIDPNLGLILIMLPFVFGLVATVFLFKPLHKQR